MLVGHVDNLYIFPLKSGAVIEAESLEFKNVGPKYAAGILKIHLHLLPRLNSHMIDRGIAVAGG